MSAIPPEARHLVRLGHKPITVAGEGEPRGARFGGRPWLPDGAVWPACPGCARSMQLFIQLDLAHVPGDELPLPRRGLLQLFYCTNSDPLCEVDLEAFAPFSAGAVARVVPREGHGALGTPVGTQPNAPRAITGWDSVEEIPNWEELPQLGVRLSEEVSDALDQSDIPRSGDKWLGWPAWIQGVEYPACRRCGESMRAVLQIDSEDNVPHMFGDVGIGHLSVCSDHPEELSFHWACY